MASGLPGVTRDTLAPQVPLSPHPLSSFHLLGAGASLEGPCQKAAHDVSPHRAQRTVGAQEGSGVGAGGRHPQDCPPAHLTHPHTGSVAQSRAPPGSVGAWAGLSNCSSASGADRGSARKGSRSQALGNHWIYATAVLQGCSGRVLESRGVPPNRLSPTRSSMYSPCLSFHRGRMYTC